MIIAIPVDESSMQGKVSESFGRSPFFLIYEMETKEFNFVENTTLTSPGGAGIKAAQIIVDNKASTLLTPRCGENAAQVLEASGIKLYQTNSTSVEKSIERFQQGKLLLLEEIHAGLHEHRSD